MDRTGVRAASQGHRLAFVALVALVCSGLAACGGSGGKVSATSLDGRLMPAAFVAGFHQQRTFDWSDPVNLVGEGFLLPQATHPSDALKQVTKAGFEGAAGERLTKGQPQNEDQATVGVIKLASPAKAQALRAWMHGQDLQQPCYSACIYRPKAISVAGVPGAVAVAQVPTSKPPGAPPPGARPPGAKPVTLPPGALQGPPTNYSVEFTVGPYLYFATTDGPPAAQAQFVATIGRYYGRVRSLR
jgi:hypothetical protein